MRKVGRKSSCEFYCLILRYLRGHVQRAHNFYALKAKNESLGFITLNQIAIEEYSQQGNPGESF